VSALRTCALCGARYAEGRLACAACPLRRGCALECCPHCGYTEPPESGIAGWIRRLLSGGAERRA
jgi:hypothetical protein